MNDSRFRYIPQRFAIFTLLPMFSVDRYHNWWGPKFWKRAKEPIELKRRRK